MHVRVVSMLSVVAVAGILAGSPAARAQDAQPRPTFRAAVDLVSVAAVVRDKKGRIVQSLTAEDFVVTDAGARRAIVDLQTDENAPASVALLVDGSGSMAFGEAMPSSRLIGEVLLRRLRRERDMAALLSFDTRLITHQEFTGEFDRVLEGLAQVDAFGSTSIYDAIAGSAAAVADRTHHRRALVVLTDGDDNASTYSPEEVAWIASTIDVPVYVFALGMVERADRPAVEHRNGPEWHALFELARATGGDYFVAPTPALVVEATRRLLDELRHQYLIAFEPTPSGGLRAIEIGVRDRDLKVRARRWYSPASGIGD
jgi:Ca-activated chloride channel family protein